MAMQVTDPDGPIGSSSEMLELVKRRGCRAVLACRRSRLLFVCLPIAIVVPISFFTALAEFLPLGLSLRWYCAFWVEALQTSFLVAFASSSLLALIRGRLAAYGLTRGNFFDRRGLELNFAVPMVSLHIISAVALYIAFAEAGLLGCLSGVILAHTVSAAPYVVLVGSHAVSGFARRI